MQQPKRRSYSRRRTSNPLNTVLIIAGIVLFAGLLVIISDRSGGSSAPKKSSTQQEDQTGDLEAHIASLKRYTDSPDEGIGKAKALLAQVKSAEQQKKIIDFYNSFITTKTKRYLKELEELTGTVKELAQNGRFQDAHNKVDKFKKHCEGVYTTKLKIVTRLQTEISGLSSEIKTIRFEYSTKLLQQLRDAIAADKYDQANDLFLNITKIATEKNLEEADRIMDVYVAAKLAEERKSRDVASADSGGEGTGFRSPSDPAAAGAGEGPEKDDPFEEPREVPEDPFPPAGDDGGSGSGGDFFPPAEDDFFPDPEKKADTPALSATETTLFSKLTKNKEGDLLVTHKGHKAKLHFTSTTKLFWDQAVPENKYNQYLAPKDPVLLLGQTMTMQWRGPQRGSDPANGKRIKNVELLLIGKGFPQRAVWNHPTNRQLLWLKGSYVEFSPPALFNLDNARYLILGAPRYIVRREELTQEKLSPGYVFVKGKIQGLEKESKEPGDFFVETLVLLPNSKVVRTAPYISILKEPVY